MSEPTQQERSPLDQVQELFDFLQGIVPDGYKIPDDHVPRLSPDQAWTVVWFLGNLYWQVPDHIERCDDCGCLFNSEAEGGGTEDGPNFCESCWDQECLEQEREESLRQDDEQARLEQTP